MNVDRIREVGVTFAAAALGLVALAAGLFSGSAFASQADEIERTVGQLEVAAAKKWPDSFAGLWIKGDPKNGVYIAFTSDSEAKVADLAQLDIYPDPEHLVPVAREHSVRYLDDLLNRIVADRDQAQAGKGVFARVADGKYDVAVDPRKSEVAVHIDGPNSDDPGLFRQVYGAAVQVYDRKPAEPNCTNRFQCGYSLRGGIELYSNVASCTSAFAVDRSGKRQLLSAAHCSNGVGQHRRHGINISPNLVGTTVARQMSGPADVEAVSVGGGFTAYPRVYRTHADFHAPIYSKSSYSTMPIGKTLCKLGITSNRTCGEVQLKNVAPSYVPSSHSFVWASMCSSPGDSGGSIIAGTQAVGVLSGGGDNCDDPIPGGTVFTHIDFALSTMGATLALTP